MQNSLTTKTPKALPISPEFEAQSGSLAPKPDLNTGLSFLETAAKSFGLKNTDSAAFMVSSLVESNFEVIAKNCSAVNGFLAMVAEMNPQDPVEALLIAQMVTCANQAMKIMKKITNTDSSMPSSTEAAHSSLKLADKLMRTYAVQVETLLRYKKKGNQRIIVERINVNDGGQAIVGNIDRGRQD